MLWQSSENCPKHMTGVVEFLVRWTAGPDISRMNDSIYTVAQQYQGNSGRQGWGGDGRGILSGCYQE